MSGRPWTSNELDVLRAHYSAAGSDPVSIEGLSKHLGRSYASVALKASRLGLGCYERHKIVGGQQPSPRKFTNDSDRRLAQSERMKQFLSERGHPRGALGLRHTAEAKAKMAAAIRRAWDDPSSAFNSDAHRQGQSDRRLALNLALRGLAHGYCRTESTSGRREDLAGRYFRSSWEANYARYLEWRRQRGDITSWEYECKTFVFEAIKRGTRSYTPDFRVLFHGGRHEWHEVKGWMDPKSLTRLDRMARYFPDEVVRIIDEKWFKMARRAGLYAVIPNWEGRLR